MPDILRLAARAFLMTTQDLKGRSILIVEDEALIGFDMAQAFEEHGATVTFTSEVKHALLLVEHNGLSAAILDHVLSDGESTPLYARLRERGIPFLTYTGTIKDWNMPDVPHIAKPASMDRVVAAIVDLIDSAGSPAPPHVG